MHILDVPVPSEVPSLTACLHWTLLLPQERPGAVHQVELPPSLRNNVAVLDAPNPDAPGGVTKVYLLAMSHVSKTSVEQVRGRLVERAR